MVLDLLIMDNKSQIGKEVVRDVLIGDVRTEQSLSANGKIYNVGSSTFYPNFIYITFKNLNTMMALLKPLEKRWDVGTLIDMFL